MKKNMKNLIKEILNDTKQDMTDEETLHLLLQNKISENSDKKASEKYTFGEKAADKIAKFAGSWKFIFSFLAILIIWMIINVAFLANPFDKYPFILLNLVLSCLAAIQAPLIMMSQNRQEDKDRKRAENDFKVNLKSEIVIEDLHVKMDEMIKKQKELYKEMEVIKNNYARIQAEGNTIEDNKAEEQTDLESQTEAPQI